MDNRPPSNAPRHKLGIALGMLAVAADASIPPMRTAGRVTLARVRGTERSKPFRHTLPLEVQAELRAGRKARRKARMRLRKRRGWR